MSSKRPRNEGSSSKAAKSWDKTTFISEEAWGKYNSTILNKSMVPERGLRPEPNKDGEMWAMIVERKWVRFTLQPENAIIALVREFYSNALAEGPAVVTVRGQAVAYDSAAINAFYHVPGHQKDYLEKALSSSELDDLVKRLCKPGTKWKTNQFTGEKTSFPQAALSKYGKAWYSFICANLMPTRHISDVTKERAVLLFAIVTGMKVDIGVAIHDSILRAIKGGSSGGLPHPSLITKLCKRAKVPWRPEELIDLPMAIIDHALIKRFSVWEGAESHPRGEGYLPATQPPPTEEAGTSSQPPELTSSSVAEIMASLNLLHQKVDGQHRRVNKRLDSHARRLDTVAQRQDLFAQYHAEFATTISNIYTQFAGDEVESVPYQFPPRPLYPPYPPPSPEGEAEGTAEGEAEGEGEGHDDGGE